MNVALSNNMIGELVPDYIPIDVAEVNRSQFTIIYCHYQRCVY